MGVLTESTLKAFDNILLSLKFTLGPPGNVIVPTIPAPTTQKGVTTLMTCSVIIFALTVVLLNDFVFLIITGWDS